MHEVTKRVDGQFNLDLTKPAVSTNLVDLKLYGSFLIHRGPMIPVFRANVYESGDGRYCVKDN